MSRVARPQEVTVVVERGMVLLIIHGQGALTLAPNTAHGIARELVRCANEAEGGKRKP